MPESEPWSDTSRRVNKVMIVLITLFTVVAVLYYGRMLIGAF